MLKRVYVSICYITRVKHLHEPSVSIACSAGVFFGRANVFACESAILKLTEERRKWGESKGAGRGRGERRENPLPLPLSFFRPRTYPKGYYFYSPQSSTVIKSKMAATGYNNTNMNKVSPTPNTPALQAIRQQCISSTISFIRCSLHFHDPL